MEQLLNKKLVYNYLVDQKKKEINHFERAEIICKYLKDTKTSIRKLAEELEISKSTIEDWMLWNRFSRDEIKILQTKGYSHTEIYRLLRNNKSQTNDMILDKPTKLSIILKECNKNIKPFMTKTRDCSSAREDIKILQNNLNRLLMYMDMQKR